MTSHLRLVPATIPPLAPGSYTTEIGQRILHYLPAARERWRAIRAGWEATAHQDWSVWEGFESLARSERFVFARRKNASPSHFFGEALVARELEDHGFTCWATCRLFASRGTHGVYAAQTAEVERLLVRAGLPLLRRFQKQLSFTPRNPDLIAFHERLGWRFVEVKVNGDRLRIEQLQTLAFLRQLLPARVEVMRLVPEGTRVKRREWECSYRVRS